MLVVCHPKILHKHCLQFLLGVKMTPRETENFKVTNKEHYGMKLWIYENHMQDLEYPRGRRPRAVLRPRAQFIWTAEWRIIWSKIIAVEYATYAVAKRKPEKIQACTRADSNPWKFRGSHIWFFHIFIISSLSFHGFITNQFNDLLPVGLLA